MNIFISAGEASGDLHASRLARSIWSVAPETRLSCLGGPLLREAGVPVIVDNRELSVVGAFEVAAHARALYGSWRKLTSHLRINPPDVVVLIDFPDFNSLLARVAGRIGSKVFYYISPQIWAWREGRVRSIKRTAAGMAVILPFEKSFYRSHGMDVHYVGHPLIDTVLTVAPKEECDRLYRVGQGPLVGLLPGSRRSEIKLLFDLIMESAGIISENFPDAKFVIPVAPSLNPAEIAQRAERHNLPVRIVPNDTYRVIRACDLIITASGTVTLEAAILGTPMIITNRVSRLSAQIGKLLIHVKHIGLPNLIAGLEVSPEFVQDRARSDLIGEEAVRLLKDPMLLGAQRLELMRIREQLGEPGISDRVAGLVLETAGWTDERP